MLIPCVRALCFNTQPPKGGWGPKADSAPSQYVFQHTAA